MRNDTENPVESLVALARAAADAGIDWRARLGDEWIPATLAREGAARVESALTEWLDGDEAPPGDLAETLARVVDEALSSQGVD